MSVLSISTPLATVQFSDLSDSEVAASILRSSRHHQQNRQNASSSSTRRPGVRSIRRLLNSHNISDYDTDNPIYDYDSYISGASDNEIEIDFDPNIVEFDWNGDFIQVGPEFFTSPMTEKFRTAKNSNENNNGDKIHRRIRRMEKDREVRKVQRARRREKREQVLAQTENLNENSFSGGEGKYAENENIERGKLNQLRTQRNSLSSSTSISNNNNMNIDENEIINNDDEEDEKIIDSNSPGQELSSDLWSLIDRATRSYLREMSDFEFMKELESVIFSFKSNESNNNNNRSFSNLNISGNYFIIETMTNESIELLFNDLFVKNLAQGSLPFHLLYPATINTNDKKSQRRKNSYSPHLLLIIKKRKGFIYHNASLMKHIQTHYKQIN